MVGAGMSKLYQSQLINQIQQFRTSFQQLGTDIQSGNISSAQQDFANLTKTTSPSDAQTSSALQQLGNNLQSGNISSAQQDYITIQRAMQKHLAHPSSTPAADTPASIDPLGLLKSLAVTAASAYGAAGMMAGV